jgi:hypothetical protein
MVREIKEIEIAQLDLRYACTRIERPKESLALAAAIERLGQIVPVIVTNTHVLLDGYVRVKAMTHLGRDTIMAEIWDCPEEEALIEVLARSHGRKWEVIEEAAILAELHDRCHLSQERIASMAGRRQSWVSSRLALYNALSGDIVELIRKGSVSTWTATRVIAPIARAIPEHGSALSESLSKTSLSTRDMALFFRHYQKAARRQRENMVRDPALFLKSLHARGEVLNTRILKEGPEGTWLRDLKVIAHMLTGLMKKVPTVFHRGQSNLDRRVVLTAFEDARKQFLELEKEIKRYDHGREPAGHTEPSRERSAHPADQPDPEDITERRQAGHQGDAEGAEAVPVRGYLIGRP